MAKIPRHSHFFRRWDNNYLLKLAENEGSFKAEFRMDIACFDDKLFHILEASLCVDDSKALNCLSTSGSALISAASRLAGALIMLGGGRYTEKMRTIGIAKPSFSNYLRWFLGSIESEVICCIASNFYLVI